MKSITGKSFTLLVLFFCVVVFAGCSVGPTENDLGEETGAAAVDAVEQLEQDTKQQLAASPRHQERVKVDNAGKKIYSRVVYPEVKEKAPVVVVIHENKGLTDWVRQMADDIAAQGYIAVAPDLLSSFSDEQQRTSDFATEDDATQALYTLEPGQVMSDIQAVSDYARGLKAANGRLASVGFCRGGSQSFRYAATDENLDKSFVFYGTAPEETAFYGNIDVPVIAFYGSDDERVNATIEQTQQNMEANNNVYQYEMYEGAGHAFMRKAVAEGAGQPDVDAREQAFSTMLQELEELKIPRETIPSEDTMESQSIVDLVVGTEDLSILEDIVVSLDLVPTLSEDGPFTVFAPTNAAFAGLLTDLDTTLDELLANDALLRAVVLYHVVGSNFPVSALMELTQGTLLGTVGGASLRVNNIGSVVIDESNVMTPDIIASNGRVHLIDKVLLPPTVKAELGLPTDRGEENIVDTAIQNGGFPTLVAAVEAAGLVETLAVDGPFTVFAPTEEAFGILLEDLGITTEELLADVDLLTQVLTYHVLPGFYSSQDIVSIASPFNITTVSGSPLSIKVTEGVVEVNESMVTAIDVYARNGVIHSIDKVLLPPTQE